MNHLIHNFFGTSPGSRLARWAVSCRFSIVAATLLVTASAATGAEMEVTLQSGSVVQAEIDGKFINWTEVLPDGETRTEQIQLDTVAKLSLCQTPASQKLAEIRKLLGRLQSENYLDREEAEKLLSSPKIGGRFPRLIQSHANSKSAEVAYRVERILNELDDSDDSASIQFDHLTLSSGRELTGDAGDFNLSVNVDGQRLKLQRNQLRMLKALQASAAAREIASPNSVEIVHVPTGKFYLDHQELIDFQEDPGGSRLSLTANIDETFAAKGIRFRSADPGYIGISGYGFKFPKTQTGGNSACVFDTVTRPNYPVRFHGTAIFEFCLPNQPEVRAGVHEFGLYVARVAKERDFVLEARNAVGQIVATVEAGSRDCVFMGIRSNQPIAQLRLYSNPHLKRLGRVVDKDFAFDGVCFSAPQPVEVTAQVDQSMVKLRNGNVWTGHRLEIDSDGTLELVTDEFSKRPTFEISTVQSLTFANRPGTKKPKRRSWSVQLTDGSILNVSPGKTFTSQLLPKHEFQPKQVVALWPSDAPARLPQPGDFDNASQVIVFPTCRMTANDLRFHRDSYAWSTLKTRLQDLGPNASEAAANENPAPNVEEIVYREAQPEEAPSVWLAPPGNPPPRAGQVRLTDGQRLVFGEQAFFRLTEFGKHATQLTFDQTVVKIPIERILSIQFETQP